MRKFLMVILVLTLAISLCACTKDEPLEPDADNIIQKLPATDEEIDRLIRGNIEIWDYLLTEPLEHDWNGALEYKNLSYYPVTDDRFDDWKEWENHVLSVYTDEYAEMQIFCDNTVINIDGKTYTLDGGRGKDVSNNYEIVSITGDDLSAACTVEVKFPYLLEDMEGQYKQNSYYLRNTENGWRIDVHDDNGMFEYHETERVEIPGLTNTGILSDDEIDYLIREHIRIYQYLTINSLPNTWDEGKVDIYGSDGQRSMTYYPVTDERYDTWEEWENYIRAVCTSEHAEYWLKYGDSDFASVISVNGRTYTVDGARGEDRANDRFEVFTQDGDGVSEYTVVVKVPRVGEGDEGLFDTDIYTFEKTADGWRISDWSIRSDEGGI